MARRFRSKPDKINPARDSPSKNRSRKKQAGQEKIQQLQQSVGNRAVGRMIQAKLKIGQPGDKYEQEADHVADQVVNTPESSAGQKPDISQAPGSSVQRIPETEDERRVVQGPHEQFEGAHEEEEQFVRRMPVAEEDEALQRQENEEEEEQTLQAKTDTPGLSVSNKAQSKIDNMKGGGEPLPKETRNYFEKKMGADFSKVRVHKDSSAADTAKSVNAKAFTVGKDVAFGSGQYAPESSEGKKLLAHELTHVVQQEGATTSRNKSIQVQKTGEQRLQGGFFGKVWKGIKKGAKWVGAGLQG